METALLFYRIPEVAAILKISRPGIYNLIARGELPVVRFGGSVRIPARDFDAWLEAKIASAKSPSS